MAHTEHAKKSHRKSLKRREQNRAARSAIKTTLKAARAAATADPKVLAAALSAAAARLDKAARHRVIHPNKAARLKSRLAKAVAKARASGS
jgi:small subunit ribosomal protein S20